MVNNSSKNKEECLLASGTKEISYKALIDCAPIHPVRTSLY